MKKIIVALDSFKGCLTSTEANRAAAEGIRQSMPNTEVIEIPVSDGGEGWLEAFSSANVGGELVEVNVKDPLMRPITAHYLLKGDTAVIEMAKASGLSLLTEAERNPMVATTYGTGQLVVHAVRRGCKHIVVGLGGSATNDCGMGMLRALVDAFAKHEDSLKRLQRSSAWDEITALRDVCFTIATDVTNPLCGDNGAAHVFAPQKGATPEMVRLLDARAKKFAEFSARHFGYDCQETPGAGAAGGLGYAFLQYLHATRRSGIDLLLDEVGFEDHLKQADLVITGEGSADRQTLMGKLPYGILQRAKTHRVPVVLIAGRIKDSHLLLNAGFLRAVCINPADLPIEEAMKPENAKKNISKAVSNCAKEDISKLVSNTV